MTVQEATWHIHDSPEKRKTRALQSIDEQIAHYSAQLAEIENDLIFARWIQPQSEAIAAANPLDIELKLQRQPWELQREAEGLWETIEHFRQIRVQIEQDPFTA